MLMFLNECIIDLIRLWLPAAAFGTGSGIKGFIGFGFQLQCLGSKLFSEVEILHSKQNKLYVEIEIMTFESLL